MKFESLIIATGNEGKFREFREIASGLAEELVFAPEIAGMVVEERGRTYRENAMLKAVAWSEKSSLACLADDSGLEVDALDGAPGLYSARVIAEGETHSSWLLGQLGDCTNRRARFVASLALCVPGEYTLITEGCCPGNIATSPSGNNGFGYDPVFIPDGYSLTFAQLDSHTKNSISHRTNSFRKLFDIVHNL